jgi:hypothetical protein
MYPWGGNTVPFLGLLTAIVGTCTTIAVVFTEPYITIAGALSTDSHTSYTLLLAMASTLIASFITGQIRQLLLRQIDASLDSDDDTNLNERALIPVSRFALLDGRWQTILTMSSVAEKFRHPRIAIVYLVTGLISSTLITAFSPNNTVRQYPFSSVLPLGPNRCVVGEAASRQYSLDYWWPTPDSALGAESGYFIPAPLSDCPTEDAITLSGNINIDNPSVYAYVDGGVAVGPTAIGTPMTIYSSTGWPNPGLAELIDMYGPNIANTSQCVPVMVKNPISCHMGGYVEINGPYAVTAVGDDGQCSQPANFNFSTAPSAFSSISAHGMCPHGRVGQGTIVFGAFWYYAQLLALTVGDTEFVPGSGSNNGTYTVTCSVDTTDVFEYRMVTLSMQNSEIITTSRYAKSLTGGEACNPSFNTTGQVQYATAAAANWELLKEGEGFDGFFEAIMRVSVINSTAFEPREPPWAFNNSVNALEDVMGLTAALVLSRINSSTVSIPGNSVVTATRIGSGRWYTVFLCLPVGFASIILAILMATTKSNAKVNSGSLDSLIKFGRTISDVPLATLLHDEDDR